MVTGKDLAINAYRAILSVLVLRVGTAIHVVEDIIPHTPKPHIEAIQFIMKGSGTASPELEPDGDWGDESRRSLARLYAISTE